MRTNRKTLAAGLGAAGVLGLGLYLAVPAFAADPSPSASPTVKPNEPGKERPSGWRHGPRGHGEDGHGRKGHGEKGFGGQGIHGEATVQRDGEFRVRTWQRGKITALPSGGLTVRSADDVSWTWRTDGDTLIRKDRKKTGLAGLASGDEVMVAGTRSGETRTAKLIRVR